MGLICTYLLLKATKRPTILLEHRLSLQTFVDFIAGSTTDSKDSLTVVCQSVSQGMVGHEAPDCAAGDHAVSQQDGDFCSCAVSVLVLMLAMGNAVESQDVAVFSHHLVFLHRVPV